jgi:DNA-binding NarL/FixJ family response regulator
MEVLIVDDDPLTREMMPPLLREALGEVSIVAVGDLESAFQRLAHHKAPDFALLDLGLPGHAGLDTLRRFRWKFTEVPVVVLSAIEDAATVRVARGMGVVGYLPKTLTPEQRIEALRTIGGGGNFFPEVSPPKQ